MANYEAVYEGASYLLDPGYGTFTGYRVPTGSLGATTSTQTANQLKEVTNLLNQGMKQTELSVINPEFFEMMPKNQLEEIKRLNKLVGAESSLHAPVMGVDISGVNDQGWSEDNRRAVEKQFTSVVERAHELDPNGNVPVTFHASAALPGSLKIPDKEKGEILQTMTAVDQETGRATQLKREPKFYPNMTPKELRAAKPRDPEEELSIANRSYWDNKLSELLFNKDRADEILGKFYPAIATDIQTKGPEGLNPEQQIALGNVNNAQTFLDNSYLSMISIFNQAYKYGDEARRRQLEEVSKKFQPIMEEYHKNPYENIGKFSQGFQNLIGAMRPLTEGYAFKAEDGRRIEVPAIQIYVPVEEFAINKASETLSNVALNAYQKFGEKAPIVSVENPPYGGALSTGEDLKNLIVVTREKFAKNLMSQGKSRGEAERAAEKLIGATWDTSHISMIRKQGFGPEKITEETKKIAPFVKHVHYNDNFGHTHTDLPPGMGDVPFKDIMNELNKEDFGGKMVFEGAQFFQNFQASPHPYVLEGSGSPVYMGGIGPYWNQMTSGPTGYMSGMGEINPPIHHSLYGAGFSNLPAELGGNIPGQTNRMSGTPMA